MTDPRREEYRAECQAAARCGVVLLKWPKICSLLVSNLNDNVNEQLLREELKSCGEVAVVKIPTLHGRSLGLARVQLPPGVKPDRFIKAFQGRELFGQPMSIVVDQGAKKFEESVKNAKSPNNVEKSKEVPQTSPKKRVRTTDSPNYSPASPARPVSDSDAPSPSNPKRPRCSSSMSSPYRHERTRPSGENNHYRSHGERQFFQNRRDSYRSREAVPRNYSRSFARDGYRDYRERYQENRDRYENRSSFPDRNRSLDAGSRHHRNESYVDHYKQPYMHRNRYDAHRHNDRRYGDSYMNRNRSTLPPTESTYNRDLPGKRDSHTASGASTGARQGVPRDEKRDKETFWMDDIRPAIHVKQVPRGTRSDDLLRTFHVFRPRNVISSGYGSWTVSFNSSEDRNAAASVRWFRIRNCRVEVTPSSHVVGRKCIGEATGNRTRRYEGYSGDFDKRSQTGADRTVSNKFGPVQFQHRDEGDSVHDRRIENHRKDSPVERRSSGHSSSYRGVDDALRIRTEPKRQATNSEHEITPGQHNSKGKRSDQYSKNEAHRKEERGRADRTVFPHRQAKGESWQQGASKYTENRKATDTGKRRVGEGRSMREASLDDSARPKTSSRDIAKAGSRTSSGKNGDSARSSISDPCDAVRKDIVKEISSHDKRRSGNEGRSEPTLADDSKKVSLPSEDRAEEAQKTATVGKSKKLTAEEFADIIAQYVYRTTKESIAIRGLAVQKSLVVQGVVKFLKLRRDKENREKAIAKQAELAKRQADKSNPEKDGGVSSSGRKTAHLDLVETFLKPAKPRQMKPPLPVRQTETPSRKRLRKSRFADSRGTDSEQEVRPGSSVFEEDEPKSPEDRLDTSGSKRRRLVLPSSPGSPDPEHASPDGNRQNSVESMASSELFREKDLHQRRKGDENVKLEESVAPHDSILRIENPQVRHTKASSLKLSSSSPGEGSIPHLVLSTRPPPSPALTGPVGSAFTTSEDSMSQGPSKSSGITKKGSSRKTKTGSKTKKKGSRGQIRSSKKSSETTTDDEQYAGLLLSLNEKIKKPRGVDIPLAVELLNENGFVDCEKDEYSDKTKEVEAEKDRELLKDSVEKMDEADPDECEPPERVGKCARTDMYVRAEHVGQHRQRNVHSRTSTSTQSSRECRQENRIYRKGVSHINPKNDIISLNHLKQRRKMVSFGQSRIHGMGLYAKENIEAGEFIIEYVGDLIRRVVADLREKKYARQGMGDSYLFRLSGDWVVDATRRGGIARYINHSCEPNLIAKIISVVGEPKIVFYSKRCIKEGEELTYDYKFDYEAEDQKIPCLCQAPSCRKYLN